MLAQNQVAAAFLIDHVGRVDQSIPDHDYEKQWCPGRKLREANGAVFPNVVDAGNGRGFHLVDENHGSGLGDATKHGRRRLYSAALYPVPKRRGVVKKELTAESVLAGFLGALTFPVGAVRFRVVGDDLWCQFLVRIGAPPQIRRVDGAAVPLPDLRANPE